MEKTKVNVEITGEQLLGVLTRLPKMESDIKEIKNALVENQNCQIRCNSFDMQLSKMDEDIKDLKTGIDKIHSEKRDFWTWFKRTVIAGLLAIFIAAMTTLLYKGIKYDRDEQSKQTKSVSRIKK